MTQYIDIADITITSGSPTVTVNSAEDISNYQDGDIIFVAGQAPIFILSIALQVITLRSNAPFSASNAAATLMASNVSLREVLLTIQTNNAAWSMHFSPFLNWISTSNLTADLKDISGNTVNVFSAQGLNSLAGSISDAVAAQSQLETDVTTLSNTVGSIQADLDNDKAASTASALLAKDWSTKATEVEAGLESAKTYALSAAQSLSDANIAKVAAQLAKTQAESILDNFDDRYLGSFAADPVLDNDGAALAVGAIYLNTTDNVLKFYEGATWLSPQESVISSVSAAAQSASDAAADKVLASQYANNPEDTYIPGTTEYSALHWKAKTVALAGGDAPNSLKLGNQLPAFYAPQSALDTQQNTLNSQTARLDEIEVYALAGLVL